MSAPLILRFTLGALFTMVASAPCQPPGQVVLLTRGEGGSERQPPAPFFLHVLDLSENDEPNEGWTIPLNPGGERMWLLLSHDSSPGILVNWAGGQPGLSLWPFEGEGGDLSLGGEIPLLTAREASDWPPNMIRGAFGRPGFGNIALILSPDRSALFWREDTADGVCVSVFELASREMDLAFSERDAGRMVWHAGRWSPDSRHLAFQPVLRAVNQVTPQTSSPFAELSVYDRRTRSVRTLVSSVAALGVSLQRPPWFSPQWTADSRRILFAQIDENDVRGGAPTERLWWWDIESDIGGPLRTQFTDPKTAVWLPDGNSYVAVGWVQQQNYLVRGEIGQTAVNPLWALHSEEGPIIVSELCPSPDGHWLLALENYLEADGPTIRAWLVDLQGDEEPRVVWQLRGETISDYRWY